MPRPFKKRRVCALPGCRRFGPWEGRAENFVAMTVDEFECIRLIDLNAMTQEECAERMGVARTTVQAIYAKARRKLADCLINGKELIVDGGDYVLCDRAGENCCPGCRCPHESGWRRKDEADQKTLESGGQHS